ncbi:DUF1285 domain-containing protein [Croceicoccus esteveae]|uniref:DUF1285 domain-containing protein n=1 Tax=Croceicoccus esteveae TaxID=3075597 RepID=UPI003D786E10
MPYTPSPDLAAMRLEDISAAVAARRLAPLEQWNPVETGTSNMRIARDGRWWHEGGIIHRPAMVRSFSALLRLDEDGFWLVMPHQKLSIIVEDAPFIATDVVALDEAGEQVLAFRTNTDELVIADAAHPITAHGDPDTPALYVLVRDRLEARLDRSTYTQLATMAMDNGSDPLAIVSRGVTFSLLPGT